MEIIKTIHYQSNDLIYFNNEKDCVEYEKLLLKVNNFLSKYENPNNYKIPSGKGYILHNENVEKIFENKILELSNEVFIGKWDECPWNKYTFLLERIISESGIKCLNHLSFRHRCMLENKEYDQPFFRSNPEKSENIQINK